MNDEVKLRHFPMELPHGVRGENVDRAVFREVHSNLWEQIFPVPRGLGEPRVRRDLLESFATRNCEYVVFYDGETPIGWSHGDQDDVITFYMRNTGLLPSHRGKGVYSAFLSRFVDYLQDVGYERVTSHHQPSNPAVIIAKLKAGFVIEGMKIDERFGPLVCAVRYLSPERRQKWVDRFSMIG